MLVRVAIVLFCVISPSLSAYAACSSADLKSKWFLEFNLNKPAQHGGCIFDLSDQAPDIGWCYNETFDFWSQIISASWKVKRNCSFTMKARFDNGQTMSGSGKISYDLAYAKGKLQVKEGKRIHKGPFEMFDWYKNDLDSNASAATTKLNAASAKVRKQSSVTGNRLTGSYKVVVE